METIIIIGYEDNGDLILTGYDEKGAVRDLKVLIGKRILKLEGIYDDILIVTD